MFIILLVRQKPKSNGNDVDDSIVSRLLLKVQEQDEIGDVKKPSSNGDDFYRGQVLERGDSEDEEDVRGDGWLKTKFHCKKQMDHYKADDYVVVDGKDKERGVADSQTQNKKERHHQNHRTSQKDKHSHRY